MQIGITRCGKCGYTQKAVPTCQSCGAALGVPSAGNAPPQTPTRSVPAADPAPPRPPTEASPLRPEPETAEAAGNQARRVTFNGTGGSLFGIQIVNIFLTFITFGLYFFWGKVRVRNYLFSQSEFENDRFAYHGTGRELLIGFLKAAVIFGTIYALFNVAPVLPGGWPVKIAAVLLAYAGLLVFVPIAMVGSRRYRLSRASWRGIRFSFRGKTTDFIKLFVRGTLLSLFTFGLYYPFFATRQYAFLTNDSYFGSRKFSFDGDGRSLFKIYLKSSLILMLWFMSLGMVLPTVSTFVEDVGQNLFGDKRSALFVVFGTLAFLTVVVVVYARSFLSAERQRYLWNHTTFDTARFRSTIEFHSMLLLNLLNLVILIVTLGFGWPWIMVRNTRYVMNRLTIEGPLDSASIQQDAQTASPTGDALDSFLNLDTGLGPA